MVKKAIVKAQQTEVLVGAASRKAGRAGEKGEEISPLKATELPADFDFIASKTADEKVEYIRAVLARSEDEAVAIIAPALQFYGTAAWVVEAYLPLILEVKRHVCRPGRPRIDPATGKRSRTWEEICEEHFRIGIRRMQQILASLRQPKLPGGAGAASRKPPVDRKEYERARRVAAPAASLAKSVVIEGLGDRFPEALEILRLADIPVPSIQPAAAIAEAIQEPDWRGVLAELAGALERHRDKLPAEIVTILRSARELLDGKPVPHAMAAPAQGKTNGNESQAEPDRGATNPPPLAEPAAAVAQDEPMPSPGDWITFDKTCKYVGRFLGRKGKSKRFVVMSWRRKPAYGNPTGWYQTLVDGVERRLSDEEVQEKFPKAWQEWRLLHPEDATGAASRPSSNMEGVDTALPSAGAPGGQAPVASPAEATPAPEVARAEGT